MNNCQKCGTENKQGMKFCMTCGTAYEAVAPKQKFCMSCGTEKNAAMKFCMSCGTAYDAFQNSYQKGSYNSFQSIIKKNLAKPVVWAGIASCLVVIIGIIIASNSNRSSSFKSYNRTANTGGTGKMSEQISSSQLYEVSYPPALNATCPRCNGTTMVTCIACDGTGQPPDIEPIPMPPGGAFNLNMSIMNSWGEFCFSCNTTGKTFCYSCRDGEIVNPDYVSYLKSLIYAAEVTGTRIFSVNDSRARYIGVEYCPSCDGAGFNVFPGHDSVSCQKCNVTGILLTFPTSYNEIDLKRSVGTRVAKTPSGEGTQRFINDMEQRWNRSQQRQELINMEYNQRMSEIKDREQLQSLFNQLFIVPQNAPKY